MLLQGNVDFFACQSDFNNAVNQNIDFFAASNPNVFTKNNESSKLETANIFDPFVAVPLNNSEESDLFGVFTAHSDPVSSEHTQNSSTKVMDNSEQVSSPVSKPTPKKDTSQIKSAIWADSLSRGLIDFNITSRKFFTNSIPLSFFLTFIKSFSSNIYFFKAYLKIS